MSHRADAWIVATGFLLREIEVSSLMVAYVDVSSPGIAALFLPVSKSDVQGNGVRRTMACWCEVAAMPGKTCPACCLHRVVFEVDGG